MFIVLKVKGTVCEMLLADTGHQCDRFGQRSLPFSLIHSDVPRWTALQPASLRVTRYKTV